MGKADWVKPTKDTKAQPRAWRTGGMKYMLALLIREFGKVKVQKELDSLPSETDYELRKLFK